MKIRIPVSVGELVDKITILKIKSTFTSDVHVHKELKKLEEIKSTITKDLSEYEIQLENVNKKLWFIEDKIRLKESLNEFDEEFIELARSVYINNDRRAKIKRKINEETNSFYKEIKVYE